MGFFSDITDTLGLTSKSQERDLRKGAEAGIAQSNLAIDETRAAREEGRGLLQPFVDVGVPAAQRLGGAVSGIQAPSQQGLGNIALRGIAGGRDTTQQLQGLAQQGIAQGGIGAAQLGGAVSDIQGLDPNVLNSPFFLAQQEQATRNLEQSAAARGRVGAGGTKDAIARQSLLLGSQFGQQDLQARLQSQGQRFGQLQSSLGFGLDAQAQGFGQTQAAGSFGQGVESLGLGQLSDLSQRDFANMLAAQQQGFGQEFDIARLGQASAADSVAGATQSAGQVSGLLTGIGNVSMAERVGRANLKSQNVQNLFTHIDNAQQAAETFTSFGG